MRLFDVNTIKQYNIILFEKQIDIILNCISYYILNEYKSKSNPKTEEENNRRTLLRDTYLQLDRIKRDEKTQKSDNRRVSKQMKKIFKKIS